MDGVFIFQSFQPSVDIIKLFEAVTDCCPSNPHFMLFTKYNKKETILKTDTEENSEKTAFFSVFTKAPTL